MLLLPPCNWLLQQASTGPRAGSVAEHVSCRAHVRVLVGTPHPRLPQSHSCLFHATSVPKLSAQLNGQAVFYIHRSTVRIRRMDGWMKDG